MLLRNVTNSEWRNDLALCFGWTSFFGQVHFRKICVGAEQHPFSEAKLSPGQTTSW